MRRYDDMDPTPRELDIEHQHFVDIQINARRRDEPPLHPNCPCIHEPLPQPSWLSRALSKLKRLRFWRGNRS